MQPQDIIAAYDALIERAHDIVGPHESGLYVYISEPGLSRIRIEGHQAILTYAELESGYYDSGDFLRAPEVKFPAEMLFWTEEQMDAWKAELKAAHAAKRKREAEVAKAQREAQEKAAYEALKRKYG